MSKKGLAALAIVVAVIVAVVVAIGVGFLFQGLPTTCLGLPWRTA